MKRDMARIVCWIRSSNRGLLIRSLDFNLRAATFSREHYGVSHCILEKVLSFGVKYELGS